MNWNKLITSLIKALCALGVVSGLHLIFLGESTITALFFCCGFTYIYILHRLIMKNRINIAELLQDCPKGMELYSPIFGEVYLDKIRPHLVIVVTTKEPGDFKEEFLYDGRYGMNGECMLFPSKGQTTWEGFVPPCEFKDGDVVATTNGGWIGITTGGDREIFIPTYCVIKSSGKFEAYFGCKEEWVFSRLATEEEKQKLFDAIKDNGYKWNAETKTLEKVVEPKFKVGDKVRHKCEKFRGKRTIISCDKSGYWTSINDWIDYENQDEWELVPPDKFDITTLKPFDKVLVRSCNYQTWTVSMFSFYNKENIHPFACIGGYVSQCIPYEGNEHLLGKVDACIDFYKTWE